MNVYESRLRPDGTTFPPVTPDPPPPPGYVDPIADLEAALEDVPDAEPDGESGTQEAPD
jgi:hypothetical protein